MVQVLLRPVSAVTSGIRNRGTRWRVSPLELVAICVVVALATLIGTLRFVSSMDAQGPYREHYGAKVSDGPEEWIVRDFFHDQRGGIFVDVGSGHAREKSNTYTLEHTLDWSGVAIDAQGHYAAGYLLHRPRTRFVTAFVSDRDDDSRAFHIPLSNPGVASSDRAYVTGVDRVARTEQVKTHTLTGILDRLGITRIDYLTMDIEREEPRALAGFDIARFRPRLVCVEGHVPVRQQILNYFAAHNYVVVGKYWDVDGMNMYFMPRDDGGLPQQEQQVRKRPST
jgi:hypothetical protein